MGILLGVIHPLLPGKAIPHLFYIELRTGDPTKNTNPAVNWLVDVITATHYGWCGAHVLMVEVTAYLRSLQGTLQ